MSWEVELSGRTEKAVAELQLEVQAAFWLLVQEIGQLGPARFNWPHYGSTHEKAPY